MLPQKGHLRSRQASPLSYHRGGNSAHERTEPLDRDSPATTSDALGDLHALESYPPIAHQRQAVILSAPPDRSGAFRADLVVFPLVELDHLVLQTVTTTVQLSERNDTTT
jgi:hypothetical protein